MKFDKPVSLSWLASFLSAELIGDGNASATGINEIHRVEKGDLVFVDHPKYYDICLQSAASFIIINKPVECPPGKALLVVDNPFNAYQKIVNEFRPFSPSMQMQSDSSTVGEGAVIMPNVYIGNHVSIGKNVILYPGVCVLDHCVIGDNSIIQAGTVIGSDAFYYNKKTDRPIHFQKMNSCGRVVIGNSVEIGSGCTIDRGVSADTKIGDGTKMDNLVHVGHDVEIGKNCLIAAQVGIAGATILEDEVILWGQVGVNKTLTIGKGSVVYAQSGVAGSLDPGQTYFGSPAVPAKEKMKELVWLKRIPELWEQLKK